TSQVTATPVPTPQATPSPTQAPTPTPTPSPTAPPTPTAPATPPPDNGFVWCGQTCASYGFSTEYPATWQPGAASNANGVQFTNPAAPDQFASFKALGPTTSTAGDIVMADLQTNYSAKPGYTPPSATGPATIGGTTWIYGVAYYQNGEQRERVVAYATVYQGQAYVIELEAADAQFDQVNAQAFGYMLGKYQFLPAQATQ
ncbi:MAG: hypothetical protein IMW89_06455, partial [Ktedonobacteraceae bacterium]|nr:hypothetical protein [Ktedonobacteraceae bacterium]